MTAWSQAAIDRVGKRLAESLVPSAEDLDALLEIQALSLPALDAALEVTASLAAASTTPLHVTHRKKTVSTLIDKLRRGTSLSSMQDVVGIRIVGLMLRSQQDGITDSLRRAFPNAKLRDRRTTPTHGYRAVHVVAKLDGRPVEIQVRTAFQHLWANATESLADRWGRGIRYGEPPSDPDRAAALAHWLGTSDVLARVEEQAEALIARAGFDATSDVGRAAVLDMMKPLITAEALLKETPAGPELARCAEDALRELDSMFPGVFSGSETRS